MLIEDKFNIRNTNNGRLEVLSNPIYQAGSLDGFVTTQLRKRDWGYEASLHGDSCTTNIAAIWHNLTNREGSLSTDNTRWSLYNLDTILNLLKNPITHIMLLRKEEVIRFLQVVTSLKVINTGSLTLRQLDEFQYYLSFYQKLKDSNYSIGEVNDPISHIYLAGLFEMSSKGTIRFESPAKFNSNGRLIIQMATPQFHFAEYLKRVHGGGNFVIKPNASYLWKITGSKAESFLENILLPNSVWGEKVFLQKIHQVQQLEQ